MLACGPCRMRWPGYAVPGRADADAELHTTSDQRRAAPADGGRRVPAKDAAAPATPRLRPGVRPRRRALRGVTGARCAGVWPTLAFRVRRIAYMATGKPYTV